MPLKIKLNNFEQFFASTSTRNNPGTFSITVWLNEPIVPGIFQQAVNDLMRRLPFLNVRLKMGFIWHYHEELNKAPRLLSVGKFPALCTPFEKGNNHLIRFIHGERHFVAEAFHTVCDGRSLTRIVSTLLARYFEILLVKGQKVNLLECDGFKDQKEMEDAYSRFADLGKIDPVKIRESYNSPNWRAYKIGYQLTSPRFLVKKFDLPLLRTKAKTFGLTISEYIVAVICDEISRDRTNALALLPVRVNIPVDCRGFFPTKSLRPFVTHKVVTMPETNDFMSMALGIKEQFSQITHGYVHEKISEMEYFRRLGQHTPLFIKKWIFSAVSRAMSDGSTTCFSNLGIVYLPGEIADRVELISFALGPEPNIPYQFACITIGNVLTLTSTTTTMDTSVVERVFNALELQ